MRPEIAAADRGFAVRRAAASWQRAGAVSAEARREIDLLHADDRVRTGEWFRLLFFVFTLVGAQGVFGVIALTLGALSPGEAAWSALLFLLAAGLAAATEVLLGHFRLRRFGVEEATGWLALAAAGGALALAVSGLDVGTPLDAVRFATVAIALPLAVFAALAAYRWGLPLAGAGSAAALFVALAPLPLGRGLWIVAALPLAWALERVAESPAAAPAHRARAREGWWVALLALYVAVHPESVRGGWFAADGGSEAAGVAALAAAWAAMVALPVFLVASGVLTRRRPRLDAGLLAAAATAASAVDALDLRPLWAALLAAGLLVVGTALLLGRLFRRAPERTLGGWTSDPLFDDADRAAALELAGAAAALSPPAREVAAEPAFEGRGGEYGGGGASAGF